MKKNTLYRHMLACGVVFALCGSAHADFDPIDLTPGSFTADVIVENTAFRPFNSYTTATMDNGTNNRGQTWYERGFDVTRMNTGIPPAGSTFAAEADANRTFKMPPSYTNSNNALLVYSAIPSATLTSTNPAAYTHLTVLSTVAGGNTTINFTINYAGGGTQAGTISILDWFNQTPIALTVNGRVNLDDGRVNDTYSNNPRLTYGTIVLTDTVNAVNSITFSSTSGNRAAIFAVSGSTDGVVFTPIDVTGFNHDIVIEAGVIPSGSYFNTVSVIMDGSATNKAGNTWYEIGFNTNTGATATGLPIHNTLVSDAFGHTFRMPPDYTTNNCAYVANIAGYQTSSLALSAPEVYTKLSFLSSAGNGPVSINATVSYADGTSEVVNFASPDWFGNDAQTFYKVLGRFNPQTLGFANVNDGAGNPRIHTNDVTLVNATASAVTNVALTWVSGGRSGVFAIAGQTNGGSAFYPAAVTGYNGDIVVEAGVARFPAQLNATTASMDGGVDNTGSTWNERGYYSLAPNAGLPPPGTVINSLAQPDHHYKLPATYTGNNAAFVDSLRSNVNLTLANPTNYSALSFLSATANNNVTNQCIMQYADGTSETNTFVSRDWFGNSPYAYSAWGRVQIGTRSMQATPLHDTGQNPRLYEAQFALGNTTSALTNVLIRFVGAVNPTTGRMVVLAVSATAGAFSPILGTVSPSPAGAYEGQNLTLTGNATGGTEPITYRWQYRPTNAGTFADVSNGGVISGATTTNLTLTGITTGNAGEYRLVATNVAGFGISSIGTVIVVSALKDITTPGDLITRINGTAPGAESEANAINNTTEKFLNFDDDATPGAAPFGGPVGFIVQPSWGQTIPGGIRSILSGVRVYTANDFEERDPTDVTIEGSDDLSNWTLVSSNSLALPGGRNASNTNSLVPLLTMQEVTFANSTNYLTYRVTFNNVKNNGTANSMQISEIELLGTFVGPTVSVVNNGNGTITIDSPTPGTLESTTNLVAPVIWANEGAISGPTIITPAVGVPEKFYRVSVP